MTRRPYMNNERILFNYIQEHLDENGICIFTDDEIAKEFNISLSTAFRWRQKLIKNEIIDCAVHCLNGSVKACFVNIKGE